MRVRYISMDRTYIKEMRALLKTAYTYLKDGKSQGCYHLHLSDGLYLVAAFNPDENCVVAKIAYNNSSLQCDYELDWCMPEFKEGDCCFTEVALDGKNFRAIAEFFYSEAKAIIRHKNKGLVYDWNQGE